MKRTATLCFYAHDTEMAAHRYSPEYDHQPGHNLSTYTRLTPNSLVATAPFIQLVWVILFGTGRLNGMPPIGQQAVNPPADPEIHLSVRAPAQATQTPDARVRTLYWSHPAGKGPFRAASTRPIHRLTRATLARYLSQNLAKLVWFAKKYTDNHPEDRGMLDFDVRYLAVATDIGEVTVAAPTYQAQGRTAAVTVRFRNGYKSLVYTDALPNEIETLRYQLINEQAGWRVSNSIYRQESHLAIVTRAVDNAGR